MMEAKMEAFEYTYSAKKQEEIQRIREKYQPREADKLEQLRQLDRSATRKGTVVSILLGVVGSLVLGIGMCFTMVWAGNLFVPGVILGLAGLAGLCPGVRDGQEARRGGQERRSRWGPHH